MPDENLDESSQLDPSALALTQEADRIYNVVRGDINNYISIFSKRPTKGLLGQLGRTRKHLEDKKWELYAATKRRGANSKDARGIGEDAAIYRNQVYALKELIAASDGLPPIPSSGYDAELLREAVLRFKQIEDNARLLEQNRLAAAEAAAQEREEREQEAARAQEEREKNELYGKIAAGVTGAIIVLFMLIAFPVFSMFLIFLLILAATGYGVYRIIK
ncbi:MAG: hypothetical protein WC073_00940 [Sterolibacterium sp.]